MFRKMVIYSTVLACLVVAGVAMKRYAPGRGRSAEAEAGDMDSRLQAYTVKPVPVRVGKAFVGELVRRVTASGTTEPAREVEIKSQINGLVKNVGVDIGQRVERGDLLVEFDDEVYRMALFMARVNLTNALLEYALMKKDRLSLMPDSINAEQLEDLRSRFEKAEKEYRAGKITFEEFNRISREYQTERILEGKASEELIEQKSGLAAAEVEYMRADYNFKNCRIPAPFNGYVADRYVQMGDLVSVNQALIRLVDLSKLRIRLQVMEGDAQYIKEGDSVQIRFAAYPDTSFTGRVIGISPVINQATRTCTILSEIDNSHGLLKAGMYATARIAVSKRKNRLLVPRDAVTVRDQRKLVFIVRDGRAFWCYVETGDENDDYIEIKSSEFDLKPGEQVIVEGHFALAHNAPVHVIGEEYLSRK